MRKLLVVSGILLVLIISLTALVTSNSSQPDNQQQTADIVLRDAHGLAVDQQDTSKVYIATHSGLLTMSRDGKLTRVGSAQDDYMGFSPHPTNANIFYTSGHSREGGNLGFQMSTDGGVNWQKISDGGNGPVDFHTMTVSQTDPTIIYGVFRGQLQRSRDSGTSWEILPAAPASIYSLTTSPITASTVFAGTAGGLYISRDSGQSWSQVEGVTATVTSVTSGGKNAEVLLVYVQGQGLIRSSDAGRSWASLTNYRGPAVMHLALDSHRSETIYLINQSLEVHASSDGGQSWDQVK